MSDFKVGDKVTCSAEYTYDGKTHLASFVRQNTYTIIQVGGNNLPDDRIVIGINGVVTAAVKADTLTLINTKATKTLREGELNKPLNSESTGKTPKDKAKDKPVSTTSALNAMFDASTTVDIQRKVVKINGEKYVVMVDTRGTADTSDDYYYPYGEAKFDFNYTDEEKEQRKGRDRKDEEYVREKNGITSGFPGLAKGWQQHLKERGYKSYNYYMDIMTYNKHQLDPNIFDMRMGYLEEIIGTRDSKLNTLHSASTLFRKYESAYNKYKLNIPYDQLSKTFAHVFFVRPDCYIYANGKGYKHGDELQGELKNDPEFYYTKMHSPQLLRELTQAGAHRRDQFMMYLSNKARSFELSDEYITSDTFGQSLTGYKVPYGKHDVESKTAGKFSVNYIDDKELHIYNLHKLWTKYIAGVYRGKFIPRKTYIKNRILDYATCVYYFLCGEDGETVIFWSKYWGVFPLEAPSSAFSYNIENIGGVHMPELKIEYQYAWKEDFNPLTMVEFNEHCSQELLYVPTYNANELIPGEAWGGPPFIETYSTKSSDVAPYTFKLRFRPDKI